jgi:eukaryotic-like serine/threonine-protein kinase
VEEGRQETRTIREALGGLLAPQTLALVAALALLVAGGWYLMRSPTADQLFDRIETAAAAGSPDDLKRAGPDIEAFLERFPDDPRAERVQELADEAEQSNPIERAFNEAKRYSLVNPERALAKFQALIDVYDDGPDNSEMTRHYIRLARVQQARLRKRVDQYVDEGRKLILARLAKADEILPDDPPAARKLYQGIVELYGEKPWADDLVERARGALADAPKRQAAAH